MKLFQTCEQLMVHLRQKKILSLQGARLRTYLDRMDEALAESQCNDTQGIVPNSGLCVEERLQNLLQVNLHYGAAHA